MARFLSSGVANTLAGFAVIFGLMALGVGPLVANVAGYAVGLALSFALSRRFVFTSDGPLRTEFVRFLVAFAIAFAANLAALQVLIGPVGMPPVIGQVVAAGVYTVAMYVLSRWFVFRPAPSSGP